jgi:hypothetical protein
MAPTPTGPTKLSLAEALTCLATSMTLVKAQLTSLEAKVSPPDTGPTVPPRTTLLQQICYLSSAVPLSKGKGKPLGKPSCVRSMPVVSGVKTGVRSRANSVNPETSAAQLGRHCMSTTQWRVTHTLS